MRLHFGLVPKKEVAKCQYAFDAYCLDTPGNHSSPSSPSPNWHGGDENAYL
jgi:hypothetical protein